MSRGTTLDSVLASLARPFQRYADTLLDLRLWVGDERRVGSCVKAYFDLCEEAPEGTEAVRGLAALRGWLEKNLEIVILDGESESCLETWPLRLVGEPDLEGFCRKAMDRLREDRCHRAPVVQLQFRYRPAFAEAA